MSRKGGSPSLSIVATFDGFASIHHFREHVVHDFVNVGHVVLDSVDICLGTLIGVLLAFAFHIAVCSE